MDIERNYARKSYRLKIPAKIIINGNEYQVVDWSFLGFRIKKDGLDIKKGEKIDVEFELPFAGFEVKFKAKAICRWCNQEEAGFEFINLPDETKLLMRQYVEAYIEGRLTSSNNEFLTLAEGIELPVETEPTLSKKEKDLLDKKLIRNTILIIIAFIILGIIGFIFYKNLPVVYSVEAFISGTTINIVSPENGTIEQIPVHAGDMVSKGDVLFKIRNKEMYLEYEGLQKSLSLKEEALSKLKDQFSKISVSNTKNNDMELKLINKQIAILTNTLNKKLKELELLKKAYDLYLIKKEYIEKLENEINNLKIQILQLKKEKSQLENDKKSKLLQYQLRTNLLYKIASLKSEIREIKNKLDILRHNLEKLTVISDGNGYIFSVYKKQGETVKKYEPVLVFSNTKENPYVIARLKLKDAEKVKIGDKAEVFIPSLKKVYYGKVVAIGKQSLASESVVSETESYALNDVPVKIKIENADKNLYAGLYAEVKIKTQSRYVFILDFISKLLGH